MAAPVGPRLPAAARLRGPGTGAFFRAPRAVFAAMRRRQHAGGLSDHAGELLPCAAAATASRDPQAADPDDAEIAAPPQACSLPARRAWRGQDLPPHPV